VRPIPAYKAGLYGLTENRQLSNSNPKPPFIPVHRTGHSACFSKKGTDLFLVDHWGEFWHEKSGSEEQWGGGVQYRNTKR